MKRISQFVFLLAIFLLASIVLFNNKKTDNIKLRVAEVAHSIFYAPQYVSLHNGYFEEVGHFSLTELMLEFVRAAVLERDPVIPHDIAIDWNQLMDISTEAVYC